jgi:hypothetical protein
LIKPKDATLYRNVGNGLYQLTQHCVPKDINLKKKLVTESAVCYYGKENWDGIIVFGDVLAPGP